MDTKQNQIMTKIQNLLNQGAPNSGASEEERNSFLAKATELMAKHRLTAEEVAAHTDSNIDPFIQEREAIIVPGCRGPRMRQSVDLIASIGTPLGVSALLSRYKYVDPYTGAQPHTRVHLYGRKSAVYMVKTLYTLLLSQVTEQMSEVQADKDDFWLTPGERGAKTRRMRSGFAYGFNHGVRRQIRETQQHLAAENDNDALLPMLRSDYERSKELWPDNIAGAMANTKMGDGAAYSGGLQAGLNANLGLGSDTMPKAPRALPAGS